MKEMADLYSNLKHCKRKLKKDIRLLKDFPYSKLKHKSSKKLRNNIKVYIKY